MANEMSTSDKVWKGLRGFFLPPVDALWGFAKGFYNFIKSPRDYFWSGYHYEDKERGDRFGRKLSFTAGLTRVLTIAATVVVILGFVGALAVPLPGVAPLYAATTLGVLKAIGITIAWSAVARAVGGFFGAIGDFFKIRSIQKSLIKQDPMLDSKKQSSTASVLCHCMKAGMGAGIIGEAGPYIMAPRDRTNSRGASPAPDNDQQAEDNAANNQAAAYVPPSPRGT